MSIISNKLMQWWIKQTYAMVNQTNLCNGESNKLMQCWIKQTYAMVNQTNKLMQWWLKQTNLCNGESNKLMQWWIKQTNLCNGESKSTLLNFFILNCHHVSLLFVTMPPSSVYKHRTFSSLRFACSYTKVIPNAKYGNLQDINLQHPYVYKQ
jgi:hypothetical protein